MVNPDDRMGYFYGVARNALHEWQRDGQREFKSRESMSKDPTSLAVSNAEEWASEETANRCLEQCLTQLTRESQETDHQLLRRRKSREDRAPPTTGKRIRQVGQRVENEVHRTRKLLRQCVAACLSPAGVTEPAFSFVAEDATEEAKMTANPDVDEVLRRYLLGNVTPEVREGVEARLFSDDAIFWEHLCLVEDELIDDYVGQDLDGKDLENFERCFLSTEERRRKLHFAQALKTSPPKTRVKQRYAASGRGCDAKIRRRPGRLRPPHCCCWSQSRALSGNSQARALNGTKSAYRCRRVSSGRSGDMKRVQIPAGCKLVRFHIESDHRIQELPGVSVSGLR